MGKLAKGSILTSRRVAWEGNSKMTTANYQAFEINPCFLPLGLSDCGF